MFTTRPGGLLQLHTLTSWLDRKDDTAKRPVATVAKGSTSDLVDAPRVFVLNVRNREGNPAAGGQKRTFKSRA